MKTQEEDPTRYVLRVKPKATGRQMTRIQRMDFSSFPPHMTPEYKRMVKKSKESQARINARGPFLK